MNDKHNISVVLIDDHQLFSLGLSEMLKNEGGFDVVGVAADGAEGMHLATTLKPDLVLLDLGMPKVGGMSVLRQLRNDGFDKAIVILTASKVESDLVDAIRSGAQGYLLKDMEFDELIVALRKLVKGETVIADQLSAVLAKLIQTGHESPRPQLFDKLTPREMQILCCLVEADSNNGIAVKLKITDGTVKLHVKSIFRKLGCGSRVEVALLALKSGICENAKIDG